LRLVDSLDDARLLLPMLSQDGTRLLRLLVVPLDVSRLTRSWRPGVLPVEYGRRLVVQG